MKTFLKIALGCLIVPIVLGIVLVIVGLAMRQAGAPQHRDETANLDQPLPGVTAGQLASEGLQTGDAMPAGAAVPVEMRLEEGNFTILPASAGSSIRVEGDYDAGAYELKQEMRKDSSGNPSYFLSFRSRYSMFRRLMTEGGVHVDKDDNKITIFLPRGIPLALNVQISKGASSLRLGGLALRSAKLDLSMGEHAVLVDEPNPLEMDRLEMRFAMGESRVENVGNFRAGDIEIWGKMGEVNIDLGQKIERDTKLVTRMRFGEMQLRVPHDARVKGRTSVFLGGTKGKLSNDEGTGFLLDVDSSASFGEVKYHRD